jgi:hypothetical protein
VPDKPKPIKPKDPKDTPGQKAKPGAPVREQERKTPRYSCY